MPDALPVVDVGALRDPSASAADRQAVARALDAAARSHGFFYATGHGVEAGAIARMVAMSRAFFLQSEQQKMRIPMRDGGAAWRGYFGPGDELTSDRPDWKEGLYLGTELGPEHPRVRSATLLHGANLWPDIEGFRPAVLEYLDALTRLGHALMSGLAVGLGLPPTWFADHGTADPLVLLRLFNYPSRPVPPDVDARWGVGEHTDYGLLTILWQDDVGGLQVRTEAGWLNAPPLHGSFVCNVGDMLDRMTGGGYRSVPHRVAINASGRDRLSIPLFFDPNFDARITPVPGVRHGGDDSGRRWDGANLRAYDGTYGDYVSAKVAKVFPELRRHVVAP